MISRRPTATPHRDFKSEMAEALHGHLPSDDMAEALSEITLIGVHMNDPLEHLRKYDLTTREGLLQCLEDMKATGDENLIRDAQERLDSFDRFNRINE